MQADPERRTVASAPSARTEAWRAGLVVGGVAAACYANALANRFALDDNDVVARNPLVRALSGVVRSFAHSYWPETSGAGQYRPLAISSFAIDWSLSHGSPIWLHAVNVAWHVAACVLVWRLAATLVSRTAATVGALVFAVHPVHVEAVANLAGRSELMCAAFVIAALLAHRRGHWTAVPLYAAALASKESGITFVAIAVAWDLLLRRPASSADSRASRASTSAGAAHVPGRASLYAAYASVTVLYAGVLAFVFRATPMVRVAAPWAHNTTGARYLTAISTVVEYLRLTVVPLHLHIAYMPQVIAIAHGLTGRVLLGALILIAAALLAWYTRRVAPPVAFAILLFAISIAPVANVVFPSGIIVAERTLYLPTVAVAIVAGWLWDHRPVDRLAFAAPALAVCAIVALGVRTWTRTPVWRDNKSAIMASLHDEPESYVAHERAADVLERTGDTLAAIREYAIARTLYPGDPYLYQAAASILVTRGDSGVAAAEQVLDSARLVEPGEYADIMRRAWVRYAARDYLGTIRLARRAYLLQRDSTDAIMVLTQAAQQLDDVADADAAYRLAIADHPQDRSLHQSYALMLTLIGDSAGAARERQKAGQGRY